MSWNRVRKQDDMMLINSESFNSHIKCRPHIHICIYTYLLCYKDLCIYVRMYVCISPYLATLPHSHMYSKFLYMCVCVCHYSTIPLHHSTQPLGFPLLHFSATFQCTYLYEHAIVERVSSVGQLVGWSVARLVGRCEN